MLHGKQCGRHYDSNLKTAEGSDKGSAQGNFGLAESDITANQPVHWSSGFQIAGNVMNGCGLIVGFLEREPGAELVIGTVCYFKGRCRFHFSLRGDPDQLFGHVANAFFQPCLAGLPSGAAKLVEESCAIFGPEPGQHLDVLDRHIKLVAALIDQPQAIMRRTGG